MRILKRAMFGAQRKKLHELIISVTPETPKRTEIFVCAPVGKTRLLRRPQAVNIKDDAIAIIF